MPQPRAVIYTQPESGFCEEAKAWLQARGVLIEERDLTQDPTARDELARLGVFEGPAVVVNGHVMIAFDPQALEAAIAEEPAPHPSLRQAAGTDQGP